VGHAGSVEGETGIAVFVEEDETTGAFGAVGQELHGGLRGTHGIGAGGAEEIAGGFGQDHFHDGLAVAGGRDRAGFVIGITTTTDERRVAHAAGELAAGAAGGSGGVEAALFVESDSTDGALFVAAMVFGGVGICATTLPRFEFGGGDEFVGIAEGNALLEGEAFGAGGDEHHVGAFFEDGAGGLDGIFDAMETSDGAGAEGGGFHDDGVAFDVAVEIEVRAVASVEDGVVLEDGDSDLDGVEGVAAVGEDAPTGLEGAEAAGLAGFDGVIGDVPGTAVDDEGWAWHWGRDEDSRRWFVTGDS